MTFSDRQQVRQLLIEHGWNTTCYQILNPGISLWVGERQASAVGFVRKSGVRVIAGAPVCSSEALPDVIEEWERSSSGQVCFFGAEQRMRELTKQDPRYSTVVLGAQPVWSPESLADQFESNPSLRAQISRARNKGVTVEQWTPEDASRSSALREILREWLETRGLPPLHFLVEPETLDNLGDRKVLVAMHESKPCAFLVLSPIPARQGWLTEQFPRTRSAPNGTVEMLMQSAAILLRDEGFALITMGMVPLASHGSDPSVHNPRWLRVLSYWARAHGRRFYNFEGLEWFKDKFGPDSWEPIYAISKEKRFSIQTLYAIVAAFTDESPPLVLLRGLGKAIRAEAQRAFHQKRKSPGERSLGL